MRRWLSLVLLLFSQCLWAESSLWQAKLKTAEDLPFDHPTKQDFLKMHELRTQAFDEWQSEWDHAVGPAKKTWLATNVKNTKIPWPVDRLVLAQARLSLSTREQFRVKQILPALQKNPYQSLSKLLGTTLGSPAAQKFFTTWDDDLISKMGEERAQFLKILAEADGKKP